MHPYLIPYSDAPKVAPKCLLSVCNLDALKNVSMVIYTMPLRGSQLFYQHDVIALMSQPLADAEHTRVLAPSWHGRHAIQSHVHTQRGTAYASQAWSSH